MSVPIVRTVAELRATVAAWRREGASVAVVPTMGALHEGHLSLVRTALEKADRVIVTLFVNPKQFNSAADLAAYPRTENRGCGKARAARRASALRAGRGRDLSGRLRHHGFGGRRQRRHVRRVPARPFRRRGDRRRQAVPSNRGRSRLLWREGFPAASGGAAHGAGSGHSDHRRRLPDCARGRWPWPCRREMSALRRPSDKPRRSLHRSCSTRPSNSPAEHRLAQRLPKRGRRSLPPATRKSNIWNCGRRRTLQPLQDSRSACAAARGGMAR